MKDGWSGMVVEWPIYGQEAFVSITLQNNMNFQNFAHSPSILF